MKEGRVSVSVRGGGVSYGGGVCELYVVLPVQIVNCLWMVVGW